METITKIKDKKIVEIQKKSKGAKGFRLSTSLNFRFDKNTVFNFDQNELSNSTNNVKFEIIGKTYYYIDASTGADYDGVLISNHPDIGAYQKN